MVLLVAEVVIPYVYREAFLPFHQRTQREAVVVAHRRMGKTVSFCNDLQLRCLQNTRQFPPPRYAWFYPTRVRAKDIAWPYLKYYSENIPGRKVIESELAIEYPNKGRVTLYGADGARGVGLWLDGVVYDEADDIPASVVADVAPALSDHKGWSVYGGMLRGRYNLWRRYEKAKSDPNAFTLVGRASETGIIDAPELVRLRGAMGESAYEMQMECNANASIAAAIYGKEMDEVRRRNGITRVPIDRTAPLDFFFDIGHSLNGDDWSCWVVQLVGRDILAHAYFAASGQVPSYYASRIRQISDAAGVPLGTVYLPHDGNRMDRQGNTAKSDLETAGIMRIRTVPRTPNVWNGINTLRALLPRLFFNSTGCEAKFHMDGAAISDEPLEIDLSDPNVKPSGVDCLDYYTKKTDHQTGVILETPVHNQYSHGADALRTFAEAYAQKMLNEGTSELVTSAARSNVVITRTPQSNGNTYSWPQRRVTITR